VTSGLPKKDWIDSWGGWWLYRWGDAAIRAVQLWVMLEVPGRYLVASTDQTRTGV